MIVGYKEYNYVRNNKKYCTVIPLIQCECGQVIGKYGLKTHQTRWTHFYFIGKLDEYKKT